MKPVFISLLLSLLISNTFSQGSNSSGNVYNVGYREFKFIDSLRQYKPEAGKDSPLFYRPLELDIWFPAKITPRDSLLPYRYFVSLFEKRANNFQSNLKMDGLADEMIRYFDANSAKENIQGASRSTTQSHLNAEALKGPFPLLIYMSAFNGMSYENVPLFEYLASRGYIVVAISSVGRYPGNMTTKYADLLEQVNDGAAVIRHFVQDPDVDAAKIGLMGYSYGGLAASMLAMQNKSVRALLSLDGSDQHYYGGEQEEDLDFDTLRQAAFFNPRALQLPYAYLESDHKLDDRNADSVYRLSSLLTEKKYYLRLLNTDHEDFSCLAGNKAPYDLVKKLSQHYFDQFLKGRESVFDYQLKALVTAKSASALFSRPGEKISDTSGAALLKGKIVTTNNEPIPYVNLGIPACNSGTVSGEDGSFSLRVSKTLLNDSIRVSSIGYQSKKYLVKDLLSILSAQQHLTLSRKNEPLREVVVKAGNIRLKTVGNTSKSKFISVGFPLRDLGSELGVSISLGKKEVLLRTFNFNISENRLDSSIFRVNIYGMKGGKPADNLLQQHIIVAMDNKAGAYKIDLTPYHLQMKGDVLISLEWLAGTAQANHGAIFFSAGFLNSSTYHRKTSEANWTRTKGMGAGFNLLVQEVD